MKRRRTRTPGPPAAPVSGAWPTTQRPRRRLIAIIAGSVVAVLVIGGVITGLLLTGGKSTGTHHVDSNGLVCSPTCLTSGGLDFDPGIPQMGLVEQAIAKQNAMVTSSGHPYVSVALLDPFTYSAQGDISQSRMVDEMRGAYLAQAQVNAKGILGLQLLLVNEGTSAEELYVPAIREIESMEARDHIVAVAGMGLSTAVTEQAATMLAKDGMPMFAALTTADEFSARNYPGYVQVTPNVESQIGVMSSTLPTPSSAILVLDKLATDSYTMDLHNDFEQFYGQGGLDLHLYPYTPHSDVTNVQFEAIAEDACYTQGPPPAVFYAGRAAVLPPLIQQFQQAPDCAGKTITIYSGGDIDGLDPGLTQSPSGAAGGRVAVVYTGIVNINLLTPQYTAAYQQYLGSIDKAQTGLHDPWGIFPYNSVMAAWSAINAVYENAPSHLPTKEEVEGLTGLLNGKLSPTGATGKGSFEESAYGTLLNPDIPIFQDANGGRTTIKP
jgi:hypothetical protein